MTKQQPDPQKNEVFAHYESVDEANRLFTSWCQLEMARTQEIILRHLPAAPAAVLDVGGGPGVYSRWLARLGYEVRLIDVVPKHIEQAKQLSLQQPDHPIASATVGDARSLAQPDGSVEAVLFLGPLYHLTERDDRLKSLREARRVLRPGGWIFAAAICRYASLLDGLFRGLIDDPRFVPMMERDLLDGQHRNATERLEYFTTSFFHLPKELRHEVTESGFSVVDLMGVDGPAWIAKDFDRRWSNPEQRQLLLRLCRTVEQEPALLGLSQHLLVVARKG